MIPGDPAVADSVDGRRPFVLGPPSEELDREAAVGTSLAAHSGAMDKQRLPNDSGFIGLPAPFFGDLLGTAHSLTFEGAKRALAERRVLIVGDDVENGGRAFVSLTHAGARARLVRRRDQLTTYLDEIRPDIVVIDFDDVVGGNTAIIRQLRHDPRTALAAMVGLSRHPSRGQRARLLAAGADDLLPKPVDARLFAQQLVEALSGPGVRP